jgi:hypothetical protein
VGEREREKERRREKEREREKKVGEKEGGAEKMQTQLVSAAIHALCSCIQSMASNYERRTQFTIAHRGHFGKGALFSVGRKPD